MKASVKLTIHRIVISNRVRVGESSPCAQPTSLVSHFIIEGSVTQAHFHGCNSGRHRRGGFFVPSLAPQGVFRKIGAFFCMVTGVILCLEESNSFIKCPAGTMVLHCRRRMSRTCSPHCEGTSLDFWVHSSLGLDRKRAAFDRPQSIEWKPVLSLLFTE